MLSRAPKQTHGFTIVETLIVLAVGGMLLVSALAMFRGRIARTQFSTALNEFDVKLRLVMNDVASGLSIGAGSGDVFCDSNSGEIGTGGKCIALGKAIHLGPVKTNCQAPPNNKECDTINIYNIKGNAFNGSTLIGKYFDASPTINGSPETYTNGYGLHIISTKRKEGAKPPVENVSGIVFTQTFGQDTPGFNLQGAPNVKMRLIEGDVGTNSADFEGYINNKLQYHAAGDVVICLGSGTTDQFGLVTIKSNNATVTTKVEVVDSCS